MTVSLTGLVIFPTVSVAVPLLTEPVGVVRAARYSLPFWPAAVAKLSVVGVAPLLTVDVKPAVWPAITVLLAGSLIVSAVSVALPLLTEPAGVVSAARYLLPFWTAADAKLSVVEVAPATSDQVVPPSVETC